MKTLAKNGLTSHALSIYALCLGGKLLYRFCGEDKVSHKFLYSDFVIPFRMLQAMSLLLACHRVRFQKILFQKFAKFKVFRYLVKKT